MESPERHPFTASIESQESPLFTFLNALSPIKPTKSVHASHSFTEFNFPPPPPVFLTPRIHAKSSLQGSKFKRVQACLESGQTRIQMDSNRDNFLTVQGEGRSMQGQDQSSHLPRNHSSKHVESRVAECMGAEFNMSCASLTSSVSQVLNGGLSHERASRSGNLQQIIPICSIDIEGTIISNDGLCKPSDSDKNEDQKCILGQSVDTFQGSHLKASSTAAHISHGSKLSNNNESSQDAADVSLLLSEITNKMSPLNVNPEMWQSGAQSSLSDLSSQSIVVTTSEYGDDKSVNDARDRESPAANKVNFPVQRGFRRRCLDFRVSDSRGMSESPPLLKPNLCSSSQIRSSCSLDPNLHLTNLGECVLAMSDASRSSDSINLSQCHLLKKSKCVLPELDPRPYAACPASATFSSSRNLLNGIGLHLNSLTGSMPVFQASGGENRNAGYLTAVKLASDVVGATQPSRQTAHQPGEILSSPSCTGFEIDLQLGGSFEKFGNCLQQETEIEEQLVISFVEETEMDLCKDHALESVAHVDLSATRNSLLKDCNPYCGLEEMSCSLDQKMASLLAVPCQMDIDCGLECSFLSGKKSRKRASTADSHETGCKRCNCKKSKCLKLYCECFAAGLFCVDNCSCQECHNRPTFEETVLEIRQQIESRNPLAFAPRVVQAVAQSPVTGDKISDITPPARHKKGCSCKKSKCLKKYCECFQAGVGCSESCRCEDCQNLYGKKEGSEGFEGNDFQSESNGKDAVEDNIDTSEFCSKLSHVSHFQHDDLSPITPSLQSMGQIGSFTMQWMTNRSCSSNEQLQTPDIHLPKLKLPKTCKAAQSSSVVQKNGSRRLSKSLVSTHEALKSAELSSQLDRLGDFCTLTPLPQPPQSKTTLSTSISCGTDSSPSISAQQSIDTPKGDSVSNMKLAQHSSPMLCQQSVRSRIFTGHAARPLKGFQCNPTNPSGNASLCGIGPNTPCEDSLLSNANTTGFSEDEDDIFPDILKEPESACRSSVLSLKSNSPKQKRVSPPHFVGFRITSQQSPALRNGRKFTLQSIPSTFAATKSAV